jgi:hypothetical protein
MFIVTAVHNSNLSKKLTTKKKKKKKKKKKGSI